MNGAKGIIAMAAAMENRDNGGATVAPGHTLRQRYGINRRYARRLLNKPQIGRVAKAYRAMPDIADAMKEISDRAIRAHHIVKDTEAAIHTHLNRKAKISLEAMA